MSQLSGTTFLPVEVAPAESSCTHSPLSAAKTGCSDQYSIGYKCFNGNEYQGRHEPLIPLEFPFMCNRL